MPQSKIQQSELVIGKKKVLKKILRYLFEVRFLPNVSSFLFNNETWLRLLPLKRFLSSIDPEKTKRIVDIGGGTGRLELALKRTDVYIYDLNEESINLAKQHFENAIVGTGEMMGFEADSFDWAISIHTLEHIPKNKREQFILEMIRISKEGVFLNFPEGEFAEKLCTNYLNALSKNGKELNHWTVEHLEMGIPFLNEIDNILKKQNKFIFKYCFIRNFKVENLYWSKIQASDNLIKSYLFTPFVSLKKYLFYRKLPSVELIVLGSKSELITKKLAEQMKII